MPAPSPTLPIDPLATLLHLGAAGQRPDAELLDRFVRGAGRGDPGAEAAFRVLVERHGPMVLGVCRRVLGGDPHAAADAFQATFLVLVRRAPAVRVDDSLGRWLHGVSLRIARRARMRICRDRARTLPLPPTGPAAEWAAPGDLTAVVDAEVARLPRPLRAAIVLCDLEGLTHDQAARRLRCAVGTVHSRVHRARRRLRAALERRGLAAPLAPALMRAEVPASLLSGTVAAACRAGVGPAARWASIASAPLAAGWIPRLAGIALALVATGAVGPARVDGDGPPSPASAIGDPRMPDGQAAPPAEPIAATFDRYRAAYERELTVLQAALERAGKTGNEQALARSKNDPDHVAYCRDMIRLAEAHPGDPVARTALLWVLLAPDRPDLGAYGDEFARAGALLVRHYGDDPEAVRVGLSLTKQVTPRRDALLAGFLASAKSRESRGLARLAMARYLATKIPLVEEARRHPGRGKHRIFGLTVAGEESRNGWLDENDEEYAARIEHARCDPAALRAEMERLAREVVTDYADIPCIKAEYRFFEAVLRENHPTRNGRAVTASDRDDLRDIVTWDGTLGPEARDLLDAEDAIRPGRTAPEIDAPDLDGNRLRLSDHRGKVVVLFFWSVIDRNNNEVPRIKAIQERYRGRPLAVLGVANPFMTQELVEREVARGRVTWPTWQDREPPRGSIARPYHVGNYPLVLVIDPAGTIRHARVRGDAIDSAVADELAAMPRAQP